MGRYYNCEECDNKNCRNCPACGRNPKAMDTTDSYRQSVKKGYYTSSIISVKDEDGNVRYQYNKPGE